MRLGAVRQITHFPGSHLGREVVPGYVLAGRIGKGRTCEVWAAEGPGGFEAALRFIPLPAGPGEAESRALEILRGVHHPNVVSTFGSFLPEGWLVLAMERADGTLLDRLRVDDAASPGIERGQLIDWLIGAARGIDYLNLGDHAGGGRGGLGIQHGGIRPGNIHFVGGGVKVADPWAPQWLEEAISRYLGRSLDPEYAAPELFLGLATRRSDQYSLAVTYCKLRGGRLPFSGSADDLAAGHLSLAPDLTMIAEEERPAVARALAKDPEERWESCGAFLDALRSAVMAPAARRIPAGSAANETRGGAAAPVDPRRSDSSPPDPPAAGTRPAGQRAPRVGETMPDARPPTQHGPGRMADGVAGVPSDRGVDDGLPHPGSTASESAPLKNRRPRIAALVSVAVVCLGALVARRDGQFSGAEGADDARDRPAPRVTSAGGSDAVERPVSEPRREGSLPAFRSGEWAEMPRVSSAADRPAEERGGEPWKSPVRRAEDLVTRLSRSIWERVSTVASSWPSTPWPWEGPGSARNSPSRPGLRTLETAIEPHVGEETSSVDVAVKTIPGPASISLEMPESLDVPAGRAAKLPLKVIRRGTTGPVEIRFEAIPRGVSVSGTVIPADRSEAECEVVTDRGASIDQARIKVVASAGSLRADTSVRLLPRPTPALEPRSRGDGLLGRGELGGALAAFREAVRLDPSDAASALGLARTLLASGDPGAANRALDEAIRLDPASVQAYGARGDARRALGDRAGALSDYGAALRLRPDDAALLNRRGLMLARQGELHRAIADFDRAIGLDPRDAAPHYNRGRVYDRLGDLVEAVAEYDRAIRLDPALAPAFRARATAHSRRGEEARARADQEEAARLERTSSHERATTRPAPLAGAMQPPQHRGGRGER